MTDPVVITIPMTPTRNLSPNGRAFWAKRHRDAQALKHATRWAVRNDGRSLYPFIPWTLHYVVAWEKGRKFMDDDNIKAALKYVQDGIAEEIGLADDRCITVGTVTQTRDPDGCGFVKVAIEGTP